MSDEKGQSTELRERIPEKSFASNANKDKGGLSTPEERFAELQRLTNEYLSEDDEALLQHAFDFSARAHEGQYRKSGEPYISHPIEVAIILADLRMDVETIIAALLHDTVEDTSVTHQQVAQEFGESVADLVEGVTKITRIEVDNLSDKQAATLRKMLVAMSKDIRVIVIKLADRLHNMRTLGALMEDRRIFKARETLEIYAPIAHRLGINNIKWELEDLAFYYLEPNKFKQVARMVSDSRSKREAYLNQIIKTLRDKMEGMGIQCAIAGRPKHLYSIYRKMVTKGRGFSEIYDLIAVRIIVKQVNDCYSVMGAVHSLWHPMHNRFKDYIATPKNNMYQSLHTTVIGPAGCPLEVQIRTEEMHRTSEYGVAAHWRYKENEQAAEGVIDQQLAWLRQMVDWQDEEQDSREFLKDLKVDLAPNEVYVFTPKGDALALRAGSTPVDFAYAIHTQVGNHCVGAKVNDSVVPLDYELELGDRVEILTQKGARPSRTWLESVKTTTARAKIKSYFAKMSRGNELQVGRETLEREMERRGVSLSSAQGMSALETLSKRMGFENEEEMYISIGLDKEDLATVAHRLERIVSGGDALHRSEQDNGVDLGVGTKVPMLTLVKQSKDAQTGSSQGIIVKGMDDVLVRLSQCCNPMPGDSIIGLATPGRGVSVHRDDCPNARGLLGDSNRLVEVSWVKAEAVVKGPYRVEVLVEAFDRRNLLLDALTALSMQQVTLLSSTAVAHENGRAKLTFLLQVPDPVAIDAVLHSLRDTEGVIDAQRVVPKVKKG